nr:unnamed protein product [uncultured bacterium]
MTEEEAIRNVAIATDTLEIEVKKVIGQLKFKDEVDKSMRQLRACAKTFAPRQSYASPYAKFNKYHKKEK